MVGKIFDAVKLHFRPQQYTIIYDYELQVDVCTLYVVHD